MCEILKTHEFVANQLMRTLDSTGTGYLMRSKDFVRVGGFPCCPNLIFSDYELWVKLISLNYLAVDQTECFSYREHPSASNGTGAKIYQQCLFEYLAFLSKLANSNPELKNVILKYSDSYLSYMLEYILFKGVGDWSKKSTAGLIRKFHEMRNSLSPTTENTLKKSLNIRVAIVVNSSLFWRYMYRLFTYLKIHINKYHV